VGRGHPGCRPRDGRRDTLEGAGKPLAEQFRAQELNMLGEHAQFEDGSVSVEAGIADMLVRMETGRFKVFKGERAALAIKGAEGKRLTYRPAN
jgi:hypothetical protein